MTRVGTFAFKVNNIERQAIAELALRLRRTQSDAVRFVVIEAAKQLTQVDSVSLDHANDPAQEPAERLVSALGRA